jgi:uncharacterized damage-inducible protein DinB
MRTLFQGFAKYNSSVNQSVLDLVSPLKKDEIMKETKAYYPSIFATMLHILATDLGWLRRYRDNLKDSNALNRCDLLSLEEKDLKKEFESDYTKLFQYRKTLDEVIILFVQDLDETRLDSNLRYRNYKGEDVQKELWKTLLHWFNHQTHHRGQISVLLDLLGVDHDFSTLVARI